jgi:hypothetical protein
MLISAMFFMMRVEHALNLSILEGPGLKTSAFQWTWPSGSSPPTPSHVHFRSESLAPPELHLPVGLALGLAIANLRKEQSRATTSIYIGSEGMRKQIKHLAVRIQQLKHRISTFMRSSQRIEMRSICRGAMRALSLAHLNARPARSG